MVQYSNECFLTGEQISSERGILIRSETSDGYKYYYIEDCLISGAGDSNFTAFSLLPSCPFTRSVSYQSIRLSSLSEEALDLITTADRGSLLEHGDLIGREEALNALTWEQHFFGMEAARANSQVREREPTPVASASQAREPEPRPAREENQEDLMAMLERTTNEQTRERYSILINSLLPRRLESVGLEQLPIIIDNSGLMKRFLQIDFSLTIKNEHGISFFKHSGKDTSLIINNNKETFTKTPLDLLLHSNPEVANLMLQLSRGEITRDQYRDEVNRALREASSSSRQP